MKRIWLLAAMAAVALLLVVRTWPGGQAEAIAPCTPHTNTSEEWQFLGLLQGWRDAQGLSGGQQLVMTNSLNQAALGYAQFLVDTPGADGHDADGAAYPAWATRAKQCGYTSSASGQVAGGEGLAGFASMGPQAALDFMVAHGGGIVIPSSSRFPVKCAGVAKATGANGRTAWVALTFIQLETTCPGAVGQAPPAATPSPTPTPTPTPPAGGVAIGLGWNLVVLPQGPIGVGMAGLAGCFDAVYGWQPREERWRRYAPDAPGYVSNLVESDGSGLWVHGTQACGT